MINETCGAGLSRVGMLASALDPAQLGRLPAGARGAAPGIGGLANIEQSLRGNGVAGLLRALPFDNRMLAGVGQVSLLTGLVSTIHRTLGVNLFSPNAAAGLTEKLGQLNRTGALQLASPHVPQLAAPDLRRLTHLTSAASALQPLHIQLFRQGGVNDMQSWLAGPSVGEALRGLENIPLRSGTLAGLSRLSGLALFSRSANSALSLDKAVDPASLGMPALANQLKAGKLTSLLSQLKTGQLASLWPAISAGRLPGGPSVGQITLPDVSQMARFNAQKASLEALQRATGLNPYDPRDAAKLSALLKSLETSGVCRVVQSVPLGGPRLDGLTKLTSLNSGLDTVQSGLGVDLLSPQGGTKLAQTVNELIPHQAAMQGGESAGEILPALSRLASLGMAVTPGVH